MNLLWPSTAPVTASTRMTGLLNLWTKEPHRQILEPPDGVRLIQERGAQSCLSPERVQRSRRYTFASGAWATPPGGRISGTLRRATPIR